MSHPDSNHSDAPIDRAWLRAALDGQADLEPSTELWPRILHSHQRRRRVRRLQQVTLLGIALAGLILVPLAWAPLAPDAPEAVLTKVPAQNAGNDFGQSELRSIDRQLEAAYARNDTRSAEHLWRRRELLMQTLMETHDAPTTQVISL